MNYTIGTKVFGDWEIVREIGEGSFGKVFEIRKDAYGVSTQSALKVIRVPKSQADIRAALNDGMDEQSVTSYFQGFVDEIIKEIAIMSTLKSHPGIVSCEDHMVIDHPGEIGWDIWIRMELLIPLQEYQASCPMDETAVRKMACDLADALAFCQKKALIHRDIKPENIFVSETGQFKLGDFGVARTAEKTTGGLSKKGTESYMAPEVYLGHPYGATVDIYSLGLVLYKFMNHGRLPLLPAYPAPITFADRENAMAKRMQGAPLPPPAAASPELSAVILKACAYDPKDRYRTAAEMLEALREIAEPNKAAEPEPDAESEEESLPAEEEAKETQDTDDGGTMGMWQQPAPLPGEEEAKEEDTDDSGTMGMWQPAPPASAPEDQPEPAPQPQPVHRWKIWLWLIPALLAVGLLVWLAVKAFAPGSSPMESAVPDVPASSAVTADSDEAEDSIEESTADDMSEAEESGAAEQPAEMTELEEQLRKVMLADLDTWDAKPTGYNLDYFGSTMEELHMQLETYDYNIEMKSDGLRFEKGNITVELSEEEETSSNGKNHFLTRKLTVSCDPQTVTDSQDQELLDGLLPEFIYLPQLGDSYSEVMANLGITEDMLESITTTVGAYHYWHEYPGSEYGSDTYYPFYMAQINANHDRLSMGYVKYVTGKDSYDIYINFSGEAERNVISISISKRDII